jgi:hypothetical protein
VDPFRHWSLVIFVLLAVIGGIIELSILARYRIVNLNAQTWKEHRWLGAILAFSLMIGLGAWISLINGVQDLYHKLRGLGAAPQDSPVVDPPPDTPWLVRPLSCEGRIVRPGLEGATLTVRTLPDICLRMIVILNTLETSRGAGRLVPVSLFERIDRLEDELRHRPRELRLADYASLIEAFGQHYELNGSLEPIEVDARAYSEEAAKGHFRAV